MDKYRRELEKLKSEAGFASFELVDGTRYRLPSNDRLAIAKFAHSMECARADYSREPRPEPLEIYKVTCKAKDREAVVRMFFPTWSPDARQHPFCPYNLWTLVEEGRLEDIPFAPSTKEQDVTPIPYATEPAHA
jgi:hypothetical protein